MQVFAAARMASMLLVVTLTLVGCSSDDERFADRSRLGSRAVAERERAAARPDPAPGSTDPDPELSPEPDAVYPPGTCYRRSSAEATARRIPCDEPHTIEVYASIDLAGGPDAPYRGRDAAFDACGTEFRLLTGIGISLATVYERSVLRPSEETWATGERDVTCYVVYPEPIAERFVDLDPVRSFGRVSIFGLETGDCLADFDDEATWYRLVDCREPHEGEVFVAHRLPDGRFPGVEEIDGLLDELCFGAGFDDYVGRDYASSSVYSLTSAPTVETWERGDRLLNCILTEGGERTGSLRGSGR